MTSTDNISSITTSSITTNFSISHPQEVHQSPIWNGREAAPIEIDSADHSSQTSAANKVESTTTTNLREKTETSNSLFNPFQNVQISLMSGFESIQNAFLTISQGIQDGISTLTNNFPHVSENKLQSNLNEELKLIQSLPGNLQDVIGSYIDPTETILDMIDNEEAIPDYLIHHARHVTNLNLPDNMTYGQLIQILSCFKNLESLDLPTCKYSNKDLPFEQTKDDLTNAISNLKKLQHLNLSRWIKSIYPITNFTDDMIERIIHEKNIRHLNIANCTNLTIKTFINIANCQTLESLNLNLCNIDDESFSEILKIKTLKELRICENKKISTQQLKRLTELPNLTILDISSMDNVTDELAEVISECKDIEYLEVSFCGNITNNALESFIKLSSLKSISLIYCDKIDDNGVHHLSNLTKLQRVNLSGCALISENCLSILEPLKDLKYLNIVTCPNINSDSLQSLYKLEKLMEVVLDVSKYSPSAIALLKKKLPSLKVTEFPRSEHWSDWANFDYVVGIC